MIPPLDENGFLPVGVFDCTLNEIKARFGSFQTSDRRPKLFQEFSSFLAEVRSAQFAVAILLDGSFTSAKAKPNDIDLVLILQPTHDLTADLSQSQYNLVSRRSVQRRYGFDIVVVRDGTSEMDEAVAFFTQVRGAPMLRKGL